MSVNPVTGIVTYTLAEWKEEREAWESDGAIRERERIIKLLDIWDCNNDRCDCDSINDCFYRQQLIKLIKGEIK